MNYQYWVVGATWDWGDEDALPLFIKRGYWYCWDANKFDQEDSGAGNSISSQQKRFQKIKPGDRIAVKRLRGKGSSEIAILAVGIVKDVDLREWRVYVDWIISDIEDRNVPLAGCVASIHGPYSKNSDKADWLQRIFCL
jgi:hypothetical protein